MMNLAPQFEPEAARDLEEALDLEEGMSGIKVSDDLPPLAAGSKLEIPSQQIRATKAVIDFTMLPVFVAVL